MNDPIYIKAHGCSFRVLYAGFEGAPDAVVAAAEAMDRFLCSRPPPEVKSIHNDAINAPVESVVPPPGVRKVEAIGLAVAKKHLPGFDGYLWLDAVS